MTRDWLNHGTPDCFLPPYKSVKTEAGRSEVCDEIHLKGVKPLFTLPVS